MSTNRRRHANAIPLTSLATWCIVALFVLGGGLAYVWCKNQLYTTGSEIKALERELAELKKKNEVALSKISQLCSTAKLQERFDRGDIKLVPIMQDRIAVLGQSGPAVQLSELRPVTNGEARE